MKALKSFSPFDLRVDVLDYLFVEWLVRNRLYSRFAKNLVTSRHTTMSARDCIRFRVRAYAALPVIDYSFLMTGAFLFESTPEGREFWNNASRRWSDFCKYFFSLLTQPL